MVIQPEQGQLLIPYPDMAMQEYWLPDALPEERLALRTRLCEVWSLEYLVRRREDLYEACEVRYHLLIA